MPEYADLFSAEDRLAIKDAIITAEKKTSGEIRVFIERSCSSDNVLERAAEVFSDLDLHKTEARNGVLFYLAVDDHKFAILGDKGINSTVPKDFWDHIRDDMQEHFKAKRFAEGLIHGIHLAGDSLVEHFPYERKDINELPDEVVFG